MTPGLAKLTEEIATEAPAELREDLWRLVYTRGHVDLDRARPYLGHDHAGILVFARELGPRRTLIVIETGDRLVGAVGAFPLPRLGSAVRFATNVTGGSAPWRLIVDEAFPLDVELRFDRPPAPHEHGWLDAMRDALAVIRTAEAVRREGLAARRRTLPPCPELPSSDTIVREKLDALRRDAERETQYTAAETAELEAFRWARQAGSQREQRRGYEREAALVRRRQERFDARMRASLEAFRSDLPALHHRIRAQHAEHDSTRIALQRLETAAFESRARTEATFSASRWLDALADAPFVVGPLGTALESLDDPARANDVLRALALLARAMPRTLGTRVAV